MGMYTELIFGASLKEKTPKDVIETLQNLLSDEEVKLPEFAQEWKYLFHTSSYYFGVNEPMKKIWYDDISKNWRISTRSNIKNYRDEIEHFLSWIEPHIKYGSGYPGFYAIVTYEESEEPKIYYLKEKK